MLLRCLLFYLFLNFEDDIVYCDNRMLSQFLKFTENVLNQANDLIKQCNSFQPGPIDCAQIMRSGNKTSGIYRIWPSAWERFGSLSVFCDMDTDGGGWTVIQKRGQYGNPQDYFFKNWDDYKLGFGDLKKEFWIGNDQLFAITNQGNYSLRIDMKDLNGEIRFALYKNFWIENENHNYKIHISSYSGNAGNSLYDTNGMNFSTKDKDLENCVNSSKGAWWYNTCFNSNLNGLNFNGTYESIGDGIIWRRWKGVSYSLPEVEMKIRPVDFK